jgi:CheY-like chemotaxis protein
MGGQLRVSSEVGAGSRFFFTIPFQPSTRDVDRDLVATEQRIVYLAEGCSVTVLVADDVPENREVLAKMLTDIGCEVKLAENGAEAVEMVKAEPPDIVFMDIRMPVMDGLEAAEQIRTTPSNSPPVNRESETLASGSTNDVRAHSPTPKLVAVSASALTHERQRYFDAGFDAFLAKPIQAEAVYDCLANLLHITYNFESQHSAGIDIAEVVLPADLFERLKAAAESYRITELTELLDEVRQTGEHGAFFAARLRQLSQTLDMPAILEILESVRHEG